MNKKVNYNQPLFSIVIANYNSGRYLEEAIMSVIKQTCQDYELIVIDGGSTDNSLSIIEKYINYFSWWVSEPDKGQSDAFNKGFSHANGEYYFWLNADDLLFVDALENAKNVIIKNEKSKWFFGNTAYINSKGEIIKCYWDIPFPNYILKRGYIGVGPSSFFHNSLYKECGPFDNAYYYSMDTDLWEKFVIRGYKPLPIKKFCWAFRIHENSKTSSSLSGNIPKEMLKEEKRRRIKNDIDCNKIILVYQKFIKILKCYPLSLYYTIRYKGIILSNTKNGLETKL
jgi:Glycosyltransferases involved in cell wall biogenesis